MNVSSYVGTLVEFDEGGTYLRLIGSSEPAMWYREEADTLVWVEDSEGLELMYVFASRSK
tara:strand:+ start:194 stop:373 length:180 start_codon:yes stop_codon:yes gene_type:complete